MEHGATFLVDRNCQIGSPVSRERVTRVITMKDTGVIIMKDTGYGRRYRNPGDEK